MTRFGGIQRLMIERFTVATVDALALPKTSTYAGRAHTPGEPTPLYGSESSRTAKCEFAYRNPVLIGALVRKTSLSGDLLTVSLVLGHEARRAGTSPAELTGKSARPCQRAVSRAFRDGAQAVRLPSARHEGGVNVVVNHAAAKSCLVTLEVSWIVLEDDRSEQP